MVPKFKHITKEAVKYCDWINYNLIKLIMSNSNQIFSMEFPDERHR